MKNNQKQVNICECCNVMRSGCKTCLVAKYNENPDKANRELNAKLRRISLPNGYDIAIR